MDNALWNKYLNLVNDNPDFFKLDEITINLKDLREVLSNGSGPAYELFNSMTAIREDESEQMMGFRGVPRVFFAQLILLSNEYRERKVSLHETKPAPLPSTNTLTSISNPLRIANFVPEGISGKIGITLCPGKKQAHAMSGSFDRDLGMDLDAVKAWGASAVVTLMEEAELLKYQVSELGDEVEARGMQWYHLPVKDAGIPDNDFENSWIYNGLRLRELLRKGKNILIHCRGGLGRSGTIAARLAVELGMLPGEAIKSVRAVRPGAIENSQQEQFIQRCEQILTDKKMNQMLGCILGGAVGDAFGYAVEFDRLSAIKQRYGEKGLTHPIYHAGKFVVSDDTQMTLFTLEGMQRACRNGNANEESLVEHIRLSYLDWLDTQSGNLPSATLHGALASIPELRVRRAPGNTCLSALKQGGKGTPEHAINDSKGCGGVMRTAPLGFISGCDAKIAGAKVGALTHGHVEGWGPSGILSLIIQRFLDNKHDIFWSIFGGFKHIHEFGHIFGRCPNADIYQRAMELAETHRDKPEEAINLLGQGWVGDEALAIAIYAFMSAESFTDTIIRATNHDGDSDSTASIAGQLWGACHGLADIPHSWIRRLDVYETIMSQAGGYKLWTM